MSQLSTLNMHPLFTRKNYLNIFAGDEFSGLSQIFAGSITSASADFNGAPEVKFKIEARVGFFGSVTAQGQGVVSGTQPAADFIARQAKAAGLTFENQNVSAQIKNSVFTGSPIEQARQAANQIGAELVIDDEKMLLIQNGGSVKMLFKLPHKFQHLRLDGHIQSSCGFIGNKQLGVAGQRDGNNHPLLHAAAELVGVIAAPFRAYAHKAQHFPRFFQSLFVGHLPCRCAALA